jgi:hypothetical protein
MPNYIVVSTDTNDYGRIDNVNLIVAASTLYSTISISGISTYANFEVINDDDWIEFIFFEGDATVPYRLQGKNHIGMGLEAVPALLNEWARNDGHQLQTALGTMRRVYFHWQERLTVIGMSYNFAVLL